MSFEDRIAAAITEAIAAGELTDTQQGVAGPWVLVGTFYDHEGASCSVITAPEGQMLHETLGLLDVGRTVYQESARRWVLGDD